MLLGTWQREARGRLMLTRPRRGVFSVTFGADWRGSKWGTLEVGVRGDD